jgi:DnaJ-class molecular chaperone
MASKSYYKILGLEDSASPEEIKSAYRKLAMKYHPDRNPGDKVAEQKIKEINEAYSILGSADKKAEYDLRLKMGTQHDPFSSAGFDPMRDFNDIFDEIFKRSRPSQNHSKIIQVMAELSLEDFENGATFKFNYNTKTYKVKIPKGLQPGMAMNHTLDTGDIAQVVLADKPHPYFERDGFDLYVTTPLTYGELNNGLDIELSILGRKISVSIPANLKVDSVLRVRGAGLWSEHAKKRGDLYLQLKLQTLSFTKEEVSKILEMEKNKKPANPSFISKKKLT